MSISATGGRPATLPGVELGSKRIISSKQALVLPELPRSMTVIGAGAIGLEFAYFYSAFGTEVTLVEYLPQVLPGGDADVCTTLEKSLARRGLSIHTGTKVVGVEDRGDGVRTTIEKDGEQSTIDTDVALVAVGVQGNVEGLGLEALGIEVERSAIRVDENLQTSVQGVYAIGDVIGPPALAHVASAEAIHAVRHLCGEDVEPFSHDNVPACIYCHPQVASVGLTEAAAREKGLDVKVGRFPYSASGKAVAVGETTGFVKIVSEVGSGEILGAHIIGADATELIAELTLGKTSELTVHDIHETIHSHPTLSESVMEAAAACLDEAVHI